MSDVQSDASQFTTDFLLSYLLARDLAQHGQSLGHLMPLLAAMLPAKPGASQQETQVLQTFRKDCLEHLRTRIDAATAMAARMKP